jgi:hypothetical protein
MKPKITFLIFILAIGMAQAQVNLNNGLVAYYPFNGDAKDESGNENDAIENTAILTPDRFGNSNSAYAFDGTNYIVVPNSSSLSLTNGLSLVSWVKLNNSSLDQKIVGKATWGPSYGYVMGVGGSTLYPEIWDVDGTRFSYQAGAITNDEWTQIIVTWTTGGRYIGYINGTQVFNQKASEKNIFPTSTNLIFGVVPWGPGSQVQSVRGAIDDVRIYNRALTEKEIFSLYHEELNPIIFTTGIQVSGINGKTTIETEAGTLQMVATILPENATSQKVKWAVINGTGKASITSDGLLTAMVNGDVTVTATALDGTGIQNSVVITVSGQIHSVYDLSIIRNGNFDLVETSGVPTYWGGWIDNGYGNLQTTVDGVAVLHNTKTHPTESWHYQFNQADLTALPDIPYIISFVAWADNDRNIEFSFEDSPEYNYNRYGISSDPESNGRSDWSFGITTTPKRYTFRVTFDQIQTNTIQKINFMITQNLGKVYLDSIWLVSETDLISISNGLPIVNTLDVNSDSPTTAIGTCKIITDGGTAVTSRGICWSTSGNPTIADSKTSDGAGTGTFLSNITGLTASTTYHVRAYATNAKGIAYGEGITFKTTEDIAMGKIIAHWTFTEQTGGSLPDHSGNGLDGQINGASWQEESGLRCLSFNGTDNYVSVPHNSKFNFGTGDFTLQAQFRTSVIPAGSFSCIFSKHNTENWYDKDFCLLIEGGTGIPFMQLCDGTSNIPKNIENCKATTNVCDGMFHKVCVIRIAGTLKIYVDGNLEGNIASTINPDSSNPVNIGRTSYNNGYGYFNGLINEITIWNEGKALGKSTITTTQISQITSVSAVSGGNVTSDGGASVIERGVCWGTTANPTIADSKTSDGTGTGSFTSNITGLTASTTYHVRAYATNSEGTGYGEDLTFTTSNEEPLNVNTGNTEVYSTTSTATNRRATPVTFDKAGTIQSISIFHNGGKGNVLLGVYADLNGLPSSQLGITALTVVNSTSGWQTVELTSPVTVISGQKVWLAWVFQNSIGVRYASGAPGRMQSTETWSAGMPATFGAATFGNNKFSIYCTYTPAETITARLGNTEVYGTASTATYRRAMPVTFGEAGTIQSISVYHNGGKGNVLLGVYADQSGSPASLLGVTASTVINSTAGWQTITLTNPVAVTSGQKVWLAWVFQNSIGVRYASGAPGRMQSTETWSAGMPATFGAATFGNNKFSIYCTYTPTETITARLGNTEVYGTASTATYRRAMPVTFGEAGTIQSISIYHNGGKGNVLLGVYADQSGSPASLLGITASTVINSAAGWQTIPLTSPVAVTSGQKVWLSWVFQNSIGVRYASGAPGRMQSTETWSAGMPLTFGFATFGNNKFSVYCTYIPGGTKSAEVVSLHFEASELKVYPNPFSDKINFEFVPANDSHAVLEIYNLLGQSVARLLDQQVEGGVMNRVEYTPTQITSGIYIYKLNLDGKISVGRIIYKE